MSTVKKEHYPTSKERDDRAAQLSSQGYEVKTVDAGGKYWVRGECSDMVWVKSKEVK